MKDKPSFTVAALYHFARVEDREALQARLRDVTARAGTFGTLLVAHEGVNGTIAGTEEGIATVVGAIRAEPGFEGLEVKYSTAAEMPFFRMKVRLKKEIVTMGVEDIDPNDIVGTYVDAEDWNELISEPDVVLVDTRNDYEVGIGTFKGAVDPKTKSFREFPDWLKGRGDIGPDTKLAMFCTGGIRCEKSTAFAKKIGVKEVYHLKGGILKYLEEIPENESLWEGECFVFDQRVSVRHGLEEGNYDQCFACRRPVSEEDKQSNAWQPGVSCPHCITERTAEQRRRYKERETQNRLAKARGEAHIGHYVAENPQD